MPQLFRQMRRKGREQLQKVLGLGAGQRRFPGRLAHPGHQLGNGRVWLNALHILAHPRRGAGAEPPQRLAARPGAQRPQRLALGVLIHKQPPHPLQKAVAAGDSLIRPGRALFQRPHKQLVKAQRVRAKLLNRLVGRNHIAAALGHALHHLFQRHIEVRMQRRALRRPAHILLLHPARLHLPPVFGQKGALALHAHLGRGHPARRSLRIIGEVVVVIAVAVAENLPRVQQLHKRLLGRDHPAVVEHLVPEARVKQVQHRVLRAPHIQIHRHPVALRLRAKGRAIVLRIAKAQVIPAASRPLGHGVGVAARGSAGLRIFRIQPAGGARKRRLKLAELRRGLPVLHLGQQQRQFVFGQQPGAAVLQMQQRKRLAPVALPAEQPIAQLVAHGRPARALCLKPRRNAALRLGRFQPVQQPRVHAHALAGKGRLGHIAPRHHLAHRQFVLPGKIPVALVVGRHRHNCAAAVTGQHIIRNPNGDALARGGVQRHGPARHAALRLSRRASPLALARRGGNIFLHLRALRRAGQRPGQRMLRGQHQISGAKNRIRPRGEDLNLPLVFRQRKANARPLRAPDPIHLHLFDVLRPVQLLQIVQQPLCIIGNAQHPLPQRHAQHRKTAALALAVYHLFIREHRAQGRAPIHRRFGLVGQPALVQLLKNPLRPFEVAGIGGVNFARPVVRKPQPLQLPPEVVGVAPGGDARVRARFHRVLFRRQAEGVPAHRVQHIEAAHALVARNGVGADVALGVPHMKPLARGIGEHIQHIEFGPGGIQLAAEGLFRNPQLLPARLNSLGVVGHRGRVAAPPPAVNRPRPSPPGEQGGLTRRRQIAHTERRAFRRAG